MVVMYTVFKDILLLQDVAGDSILKTLPFKVRTDLDNVQLELDGKSYSTEVIFPSLSHVY